MVFLTRILLICCIPDTMCLLDPNIQPPTTSTPTNSQDSHFMQQLLLQEQQLRIELQKQITSIQSQVNDLRNNVMTCENNYRKLQSTFVEFNKNFSASTNSVPHAAFFVRLRNKITNHHQSTIMVFDDVQLNAGNAYDPHIGTFTAPVDGIYKFDLVLSSDVENGHGEMMHNGVRLLDVYADKHSSFYGRGSGTIIVHMAQGDKFWIQNTDTGNTVINASVETAFSGHLLYPA